MRPAVGAGEAAWENGGSGEPREEGWLEAEVQRSIRREASQGWPRVWLGLRGTFAFLRSLAVRGGRISTGRLGAHTLPPRAALLRSERRVWDVV